jgi:hypothetical protein
LEFASSRTEGSHAALLNSRLGRCDLLAHDLAEARFLGRGEGGGHAADRIEKFGRANSP